MFHRRQALPLCDRTEARSLLPAEVIAAVARRPLATTRQYLDTWLDTVAWVVAERGPIVFDWFVVGPPAPALLEIAHELRRVRRAEAQGGFDDEEEDWYERHGGDDDAEPWEPPTLPERVVASLDGRRGYPPLATRGDVQWLIGRAIRVDHDTVFDVIEIGLTLELFVADVADVCRIGDLVVVDGRVPGERDHRWRWAA